MRPPPLLPSACQTLPMGTGAIKFQARIEAFHVQEASGIESCGSAWRFPADDLSPMVHIRVSGPSRSNAQYEEDRWPARILGQSRWRWVDAPLPIVRSVPDSATLICADVNRFARAAPIIVRFRHFTRVKLWQSFLGKESYVKRSYSAVHSSRRTLTPPPDPDDAPAQSCHTTKASPPTFAAQLQQRHSPRDETAH